jgi:hypothetical protein
MVISAEIGWPAYSGGNSSAMVSFDGVGVRQIRAAATIYENVKPSITMTGSSSTDSHSWYVNRYHNFMPIAVLWTEICRLFQFLRSSYCLVCMR